MMAVSLPFRTPFSMAFFSVASNSVASASCTTMRERIRLKVRGAMPVNSSSTPMAAFQSASTRVRREVSASEVRSWVAQSMARTITDGGTEGRPILGAYSSAKSSSETISWPWSARRS